MSKEMLNCALWAKSYFFSRYCEKFSVPGEQAKFLDLKKNVPRLHKSLVGSSTYV